MQQNLLEIYDLKYNRLSILNDNTKNCASNIQEEHTINQVSTLTFELPLTSLKWKYIINEYLVKYKGEYYIIKNPTFSHNESKKTITVQCKHLSYTLVTKIDFEIDIINYSAYDLMNSVLTNSGWILGILDSSLTQLRTLQSKEQSKFANLTKIAELFEGFLVFHSETREVDLVKSLPDRSIYIRKGKNLESVSVEYDTSSIITKLYAFGGNDIISGNEVSINLANPTGQDFVENYSYYLGLKDESGNQLYSPSYILAHPEVFMHESTWRDNNYTDATMLYNDAVKKLEKLSMPIIKCSVTGDDLSLFPQYFTASPVIGELVHIIDEDLNLNLVAQVTKINKNSDNPIQLNIEISNEIEYRNLYGSMVNAIHQTTISMDNLSRTKSSYIGSVIDIMKTKLNSTQSKWYTDTNGNMVFESLDGTKGLKLGGGIFGISNTKDSEGNFQWSTFGDGNGFVADRITLGHLKGGKVDFDLENGVFVMGNSLTDFMFKFDSNTGDAIFNGTVKAEKIDTTNAKIKTAQIETLEVGKNVAMGEGTFISWNNITNKPNADDIGAMPKATYIDADGVYTGQVYANKIKGGEITGCTIKTSTDTFTYMELHNQWVNCMFSGVKVMSIGYVFGGYRGELTTTPQIQFFSGASGIRQSEDIGELAIWNNNNRVNIKTDQGLFVNSNQVLTTASTIVAKFA